MRQTTLRDGRRVPLLGQGTWTMGTDRARRAAEVHALQLGIELGMTLIDTAEMYADGGAEEVAGEAIRGRRGQVFVVTKVLPQNASRRGTIQAAERSLRRLGIDCIDLYLLHWKSPHPLPETLAAFAELQQAGKIRSYGLSNFDTAELEAARALPHGSGIACNQVYYNLLHRGIEWSLLPLCRDAGIVVMAYTPLEQGRLTDPTLERIGRRHGATPAQVAMAWTIREQGVVAIPKSADPAHVRANAAAAALVLPAGDLAELDAAFPPPPGETALETV